MKKIALLAALTLGTLALAQQLDLNLSSRLFALTSGLLITPQSLNINAARINANRITRSLAASATLDFATQTITCNALTIALPGARVFDTCDVGTAAAGGAANSNFSCFVSAADVVTVKHCPAGTASDPVSAIYHVRVASNQ